MKYNRKYFLIPFGPLEDEGSESNNQGATNQVAETPESPSLATELEELKKKMAIQEADLIAEREKTAKLEADAAKAKLTTELEGYGASLGAEDLVKTLLTEEKSREASLEALVKHACTTIEDVKTSFEATSPQSVGNHSVEIPEGGSDTEPKDRNAAIDLVKKKFELKGEKALDKARELYPKLFNYHKED